jgi:hypothetical protein
MKCSVQTSGSDPSGRSREARGSTAVRLRLGLGLLVALLALGGLGRPRAATAATTWFVNAATGSNSNNCSSASTPCKTITAAIGKASAGDTVQVAAGTYSSEPSYPITVGENLTISGAGPGSTTINAGGSNSVFTVTAGTVSLSGMTITGGKTSGSGGGIDNAGSMTLTDVTLSDNSAPAGNGGGINNGGSMTMTDVSLSDNSAPGGGGGINNSGSMTLTDVTLSGNAGEFGGGGIFNKTGASMALTNVTLGGNLAVGGGGILNAGRATLTNVTLNGNTAEESGGDIANTSGTVAVQASIIANGPAGGDCVISGGTLTSNGFNVADDTTCNLTQTGDSQGNTSLDASLGPLALNPGPGGNGNVPQTIALLAGSPAIDRFPTSLCQAAFQALGVPLTDERGVTRPQGAACDSGAYEFVPPATPTPTPTPPATGTPTPGCGTVQEQAGWNLTGGPSGTVLSSAAAVFSLPAGAAGYVAVTPPTTPLTAPEGVWALYFSPATVALPCVSGGSAHLPLTAGQIGLVSNPFDGSATLSGTGVPTFAITLSSATDTWSGWMRIDGGSTLTLPPGGAAFVATLASGGSTVTVTSS